MLIDNIAQGVFKDLDSEQAYDVMQRALEILENWERGMQIFEGDDKFVKVGTYPVYNQVGGSFNLVVYLQKISENKVKFEVAETNMGA